MPQLDLFHLLDQKVFLIFFGTFPLLLLISLYMLPPVQIYNPLLVKSYKRKRDNDEPRDIILRCAPTTYNIVQNEYGGVFVYDANDPSGLSIKGLFYIYPSELRIPAGSNTPYMGYVKSPNLSDVRRREQSEKAIAPVFTDFFLRKIHEETLTPNGSPHFPQSAFFQFPGKDFIVSRTKLIELKSTRNVWNGEEGAVLADNVSTSLIAPRLRLGRTLANYNKTHIYVKASLEHASKV